jgi:hypothetical protein
MASCPSPLGDPASLARCSERSLFAFACLLSIMLRGQHRSQEEAAGREKDEGGEAQPVQA